MHVFNRKIGKGRALCIYTRARDFLVPWSLRHETEGMFMLERKKILEKEIEKRLVRLLEAKGCLAYKFVSPNCRGVPDRLFITPEGTVFFVELKTKQGMLSKLQYHQLIKVDGQHQLVYVLYGLDEVEEFVRELVDFDFSRVTRYGFRNRFRNFIVRHKKGGDAV